MMEERSGSGSMPEAMPTATVGGPGPANTPPHLADPRALQILTTEHWSLLASRSLSYNEAFTRAGMFLSFLAASLVALALIAQATGFTTDLAWIAALFLALDLFIGLATLGRINSAGAEELHCVRGMNRIRHAYLEIAPDLEPYFVAPWHDDPAGVLSAYSVGQDEGGAFADVMHGLTTTPGMIGVIDSVIAGALAAVVAIALGVSMVPAAVIGLVSAASVFGVIVVIGFRAAIGSMNAVPARFPSPPPRDEEPSRSPFG